jgi:hypothetical protein
MRPFRLVQDREQAAGVRRSILDVADVRDLAQPADDRQREVGALELRVRVQHDGAGDGFRNGAEIRLDAAIRDREIGLQDRKHPIRPERHHLSCERDRSRVVVAATPATTGTRPRAALTTVSTISSRCAVVR